MLKTTDFKCTYIFIHYISQNKYGNLLARFAQPQGPH